jgi:small subunit ribosomal protein S18
VESIDYKDAARFGRYVNERAKIEPRRRTGTCARHQRMLARAIKRARHLALLPIIPEHVRLGIAVGAAAPIAEAEAAKLKPVAVPQAPAEPTSDEKTD